MPKLTKSVVDSAKPNQKDYFLWDSVISGFGLRVFPSGRKSYLIQYRRNGKTRRFKIGSHGFFTVDQARIRARILFGQIAEGKDPLSEKEKQINQIKLADFCEIYLKEGCFAKKETTIQTDRGRIERHIKPLLGTKSVVSIERGDVEKFMVDIASGKTARNVKTKKFGLARVKGGKGTATRTVGLLGSIFTFAVKKGIRRNNPVYGVKRYPDNKRERFLTPEELETLGKVLSKAEKDGVNPYPLALIKLLALTGCRRGELVTLKWDFVDFENGFLVLPESKTGKKVVPIGKVAMDILKTLPREKGNPFVFPGRRGGPFQGLQKVWCDIRKLAGLSDVRLHDLRHTFASVGASGGSSLYILGKLLGHKDQKTTQRYAHLADDPVKNAADEISQVIANAMGKEKII